MAAIILGAVGLVMARFAAHYLELFVPYRPRRHAQRVPPARHRDTPPVRCLIPFWR